MKQVLTDSLARDYSWYGLKNNIRLGTTAIALTIVRKLNTVYFFLLAIKFETV